MQSDMNQPRVSYKLPAVFPSPLKAMTSGFQSFTNFSLHQSLAHLKLSNKKVPHNIETQIKANKRLQLRQRGNEEHSLQTIDTLTTLQNILNFLV